MRPGLPGYDCNDGAEESGLCELRFGYAGPGCEVFGGERVLGGESKLCGYVSYEWACGNRHAPRAETLILGGFAGLYEENEVVF